MIAELLDTVAYWPTLLLVLVVFGFAPGFCLRLIVLAYPRSDPRRAELIAELYAVPRVQRPLWVAEQLEVALFEGLAHRVSAALRRLTGRRRARAQSRLALTGFLLFNVLGLGLGLGPVLVLVLGPVLVLGLALADRFRSRRAATHGRQTGRARTRPNP
ncbi:MAG: hypothetical protein M3Q39_02960 [Actinomycetota bacterium]|nr:hypothetical protein [Actinomycetota bacterium]